jgi:spore germination cell wall hydrolase CwlJ-like protein/peptidoglycan hydrolase CwlO-like protein
VLLLLTIVFVLPAEPLTLRAEPSTAEQISQTNENIQQLRQKSEEAKEALNAANREKSAVGKRLDELNEQLTQVKQELEDIQSDIDGTNDKIAESTSAWEQLEEDRQQRYEAMKVRIRFMYERGNASLLEALLGAKSMGGLLNQIEYFAQVMSYDRDQLAAYRELLEKQQATTETLTAEKEELLALKQEQNEKLEELSGLIGDARSDLQLASANAQTAADLLDGVDTQLDQQLAYEQALEAQKAAEEKEQLAEIKRQEEALEKQKAEALRQEEEKRRQEQAQQQANAGNTENTNHSSNTGDAGNATDLELLASIIQCEADSEPYEGKLAVGSVVMNRVASGSFPNSIMLVIYQSGQFSPVASGRFAARLAAGANSACRQAAQEVLNGNITVPYLYFRTDNGTIDGQVIGTHVFY